MRIASAARSKVKAVLVPGGNPYVKTDRLGDINVVGRAIAQLAVLVIAHGVKGAADLKKTMISSGGNVRDTIGDNHLRQVGIIIAKTVSQLAIMGLTPMAQRLPSVFTKKAVLGSSGTY